MYYNLWKGQHIIAFSPSNFDRRYEMDKYLFAAMEANPSPMILVQDDRIAHQNRNAALLFGWKEGDFASVRIPDHILSAEGESFISTLVINGESFSAFAERRDGSLFISFSPDDSRESIPVVLSDNLMSSMLSGLFNIGLVKDRLEEHVTFSEKGELIKVSNASCGSFTSIT